MLCGCMGGITNSYVILNSEKLYKGELYIDDFIFMYAHFLIYKIRRRGI